MNHELVIRLRAALGGAEGRLPEPVQKQLDVVQAAGATSPDDLVTLAEDEARDEGVRVSASLLLGQLGDPGAAPALLVCLKAQTPQVRRASALALGQVGYAAAAHRLATALQTDQHPAVREAAAFALGQMPGDVDITPLLRALGAPGEVARVRSQAAESLGDLALRGVRAPEMTEALLRALEDPDAWVRHDSVVALGYLGDPTAVVSSIRLLASDSAPVVREAAAGVLAWVGSAPVPADAKRRDAVTALVFALRDAAPQVRASAATSLGELGAREALPDLQNLAARDHAPVPEGGTVAAVAERAIKRLEEDRRND